jgi:cation diffusion facilitator CzcD-associated flavoprotein CzcO
MNTVAILGAGLSGLAMAIQLQQVGIDDVTIYERGPDVGGTWLRNTYPGLHCDIPSHLYCFSFEPNPDWSMVYAGQAEIQAYLRHCAEKYGLIDRIRFDVDIRTARFDPAAGMWSLETEAGETDTHRVLVQATGGLTAPRLPRIEGLSTFEGPSWHSGSWRHDLDLRDCRVGIIGSAASAVQVVPHVASEASAVHVFSRTPNWVVPRGNRFYTDTEKAQFRDETSWNRERRKRYRSSLLWYRAQKRFASGISDLGTITLDHMKNSISDPELIEALTPPYEPGCNRILVSDDYYATLAQPHVTLVPHGVTALTPTGIVAADGSETEVDVVIYCTGYRIGSRNDGQVAVDVVGPDDVHLATALAEQPEAYYGVAIPGFPNYFTINGINGTTGYTSLFNSAELHSELVATLTRRLVDEQLGSIEARRDAADIYNRRIQTELQEMSWSGDCRNFYLNRTGRNTTFYPGTLGQMRRELRSPDTLDGFNFTAK